MCRRVAEKACQIDTVWNVFDWVKTISCIYAADAVAAVFDLVKYSNTTANEDSSKEYLEKLLALLTKHTDVLGLTVERKEEMLDAEIEKLIEERQAARKAKDFARADAIRDELLEKGIVLKDTREGVQWKRA